MTILHSIPSSLREPNQFHEIDILSAAQGLVPLDNKVLLVGTQNSAATATANEPNQVFDEEQADLLWGQGSELALMARQALAVGRLKGFQPQIWGVGVADPAGTAAIHKFTVAAGTATAAGDIVFRIGNVSFRAGVSIGDDQDAVALAMKAAVDEKLKLIPVTAAINGTNANELDLTFTYTGVNGNDLLLNVDDVGLTGMSVSVSAPTAGVGATTLTTALANGLTGDYECVAIANHASADVTALNTHLDAAWDAAQKRWRHSFMAETGTLSTATTLAGSADDHRQQIASYYNCPNWPGEIAASLAVAVSAREAPNYNWDFDEMPLGMPPDADAYTSSEVETALAAGVIPLRPNYNGSISEIVRMVTTKTTENSAPFENAKDLATIRTLIYTIRQIDAKARSQFKAVNMSARVLKRLRSVILNVLDQLEEVEYIQNVEALQDLLVVEADATVATRAVVAVPVNPVPNLHQIVFKHTLFVGG